jgi:magnesium transporter
MMAKNKKNRLRVNIGRSALTYIGEVKTNPVKITVIDFDAQKLEERELKDVKDCFSYADRETVSWINVDGVHDTQIVKTLGLYFRLHPLLQEDMVHTDQRPKVDFYENNVFVIAKMLIYNAALKKVESEQVSFVLGSTYLLSFQEDKEGDVFEPVREQIRNKPKGKIRNSGESYLFYVLMDAIVGTYVEVVEKITDELETIEEKIINEESIQNATKILYEIKRQLMIVRKAARPLQEVVSQLIREEAKFLDSTNFYMRDLYERIVLVSDNTESCIDTCANLLDLHLNLLSNKTNEVMKILTIMSAIFLPLSFIAGVYGMNFDYMPELKMGAGYFWTLGVMISVAVGLLIWFRLKKWV